MGNGILSGTGGTGGDTYSKEEVDQKLAAMEAEHNKTKSEFEDFKASTTETLKELASKLEERQRKRAGNDNSEETAAAMRATPLVAVALAAADFGQGRDDFIHDFAKV